MPSKNYALPGKKYVCWAGLCLVLSWVSTDYPPFRLAFLIRTATGEAGTRPYRLVLWEPSCGFGRILIQETEPCTATTAAK